MKYLSIPDYGFIEVISMTIDSQMTQNNFYGYVDYTVSATIPYEGSGALSIISPFLELKEVIFIDNNSQKSLLFYDVKIWNITTFYDKYVLRFTCSHIEEQYKPYTMSSLYTNDPEVSDSNDNEGVWEVVFKEGALEGYQCSVCGKYVKSFILPTSCPRCQSSMKTTHCEVKVNLTDKGN